MRLRYLVLALVLVVAYIPAGIAETEISTVHKVI